MRVVRSSVPLRCILILSVTSLLACKGPQSPPQAKAQAESAAPAFKPPPPAPVVKPPPAPAPAAAAKVPAPEAPKPSPTKLGAFTAELIDLQKGGAKTPIDAEKLGGLTAFIIIGVRCPASNAYKERMRSVAGEYGPKGVRFVFVYPNSDDTPDAKRTFHREAAFPAAMIDDQGGKVAKALKAVRTSEVFVADKTGLVHYRGPVDDNRNPTQVKERLLARALDEVLAGKPVTKPYAQVFA